jgi:GTP-binding protein Era
MKERTHPRGTAGSKRSRPRLSAAPKPRVSAAPRPLPAAPPVPKLGPAAGPPASAVAGPIAGTVAILGRPNVGKSTLMNRMVGEKLAIVTPKPQTTRIVGVWNGAGGQVVFVDTPGVHGGRKGLNRFMVGEAMGAIEGVDAALLVVDGTDGRPGDAERMILEGLAAAKKPVVLAINKVDKVKDKSAVLPMLKAWESAGAGRFGAMVPISATRGTNVDQLIGELCRILPAGAPLYGPEMLTDRTERFLAAELVREQLFLRLKQELPYATAVVIETWQERPDRGDVVIDASILVERDSQRGIVVGAGGTMIRDVGINARREIGALLDRPVHLKLEVKVVPDWTTSPEALARLGYAP